MIAPIVEATAPAHAAKTGAFGALPARLVVLLAGIYLAAFVVAPTNGRVAGTYDSPSDSGLIVIDVKNDGTYVEYDQTQEIARGRWRLRNWFHVTKSLVLDDAYALPVGLEDLHRGKIEVVYPLYHRAGQLCFTLGPDAEYWCKR